MGLLDADLDKGPAVQRFCLGEPALHRVDVAGAQHERCLEPDERVGELIAVAGQAGVLDGSPACRRGGRRPAAHPGGHEDRHVSAGELGVIAHRLELLDDAGHLLLDKPNRLVGLRRPGAARNG